MWLPSTIKGQLCLRSRARRLFPFLSLFRLRQTSKSTLFIGHYITIELFCRWTTNCPVFALVNHHSLTVSGTQWCPGLLCRFRIKGLANVSVCLPVFCLTQHRAVRRLLAALATKVSCQVSTSWLEPAPSFNTKQQEALKLCWQEHRQWWNMQHNGKMYLIS